MWKLARWLKDCGERTSGDAAPGPCSGYSVFQHGRCEFVGCFRQPSAADVLSSFHVEGCIQICSQGGVEGIVEGVEANNSIRATRAWKLLLLLPRMLLFRPSRGGFVLRKKLESRFRQFQAVQWVQLLDENEGTQCALEAHSRSIRRSRRNNGEESQRAARALSRNCRRRDKLQRELRLHWTLWPHWQLSRTHRNARHNPDSPSVNVKHRLNPRSISCWIPMHFLCACGSPDEVLLLGRQG